MDRPRTTWISALALMLALVALAVALRARSLAQAARTAMPPIPATANPALPRADALRAAADAGSETGAVKTAIVVDSVDRPSASAHTDSHRAVRQIPALQALRLAAERAAFEMTYAPLFRALKLTPAQSAEFCDHLLRRAAMKSDLDAAAAVQRLPDHDSAVREIADRADREYAEAQRALLGPAGALEALEFERSLPLREGVASIASIATLAGVPFTVDQTERLLRAVVAATPKLPGGELALATIDWTAVDVQAREFLSPAQWAILTSVETDYPNRFMAELDHAVDRARRSDEK